MRARPLFGAALLSFLSLTVPSTSSADPIYVVAQRVVFVFAVAPDQPPVQDFGFGPLNATVSGADATGMAVATQASTLGPSGIEVSGSTAARINQVLGPYAQSTLSATFQLLTPHRFFLDAVLSHTGEGRDVVRLFSYGAGMYLLDHDSFNPGSRSFARMGALPPGLYNFAIGVRSFDGSAAFRGQLGLEAAAAPVPEPATLLLLITGTASMLMRRKKR